MSSTIRTTAGLAVAILLAGTGWAAAQGLGTSRAYVKVFGGVTLPKDDNFTLAIEDEDPAASGLDYDAGYVMGIAGGYSITPNVALELEYSYRASDVELDSDGGLSGQMKSNAYMANAIYSFDAVDQAGAVRPFLGIGLGAADLTYEPDGIPRLGGDYRFAYQAIAGIGYQMNESWTISGEVRYLGVSENEVSNSLANFDTTYQSFDALVGATYRF
ncbi:opacity protein-like surface antigen [Amaricoccus macauensis]|uniref:Opacity protein-like surface antigen n=1 Tax=Amaricoccus macauensis TaxID=57001 RepID=A0A840STZ7_9RHOB|nr:OmpW family outer membrane protein [Amaricoccus macauensis]MBB5223306.1 opacity protein-like surface antigen [Amaricoccus macauensis]